MAAIKRIVRSRRRIVMVVVMLILLRAGLYFVDRDILTRFRIRVNVPPATSSVVRMDLASLRAALEDNGTTAVNASTCATTMTTMQTNLTAMRTQMEGQEQFSWILGRVEDSWSVWVAGAMDTWPPDQQPHRKRKRILVVPGVLTQTNFGSAASISGGGPLGDLVQWADLLAALHVLGHHVTVTSDIPTVVTNLNTGKFAFSSGASCQPDDFDVMFVDILFLKAVPSHVLSQYRCRFRILDAYGTEAMYNNPVYVDRYGTATDWGRLDMRLKQFFTFYPHTPDNSFMGFLVRHPPERNMTLKENIGLLYGKDIKYFTHHLPYIRQLSEFMEVHATVPSSRGLPNEVHNDGILTSKQYGELLASSKYLIGFGRPLESSGAMEGLAYGAIFLNPAFLDEQKDILSNGRKPTSRKMTSQIPYLEEFVGEPYVFTLDITNPSEIKRTLERTREIQPQSFVPHEFTAGGFLERLDFYLDTQDFCSHRPVYELKHADKHLTVIQGGSGDSCNYACREHDLLCFPEAFPLLNTKALLLRTKNATCVEFKLEADVIYPARTESGETCGLLTNATLHSCAGARPTFQRICPCRTVNKHQTAVASLTRSSAYLK